jgi:glycosyltransferase involved in cell wall biosynthesis
MSDSIHTVRWINQIADREWDLHLFSSVDYGFLHPEMRNITVYHSAYACQKEKDISVKLRGLPLFYNPFAVLARKTLSKFFPKYRAVQLGRLIDKLKPDIIHSLEIQHAGYLLFESMKFTKNKFPVSIVTNWGSDIYLFGRLSEHEPKIRAVLESSDFYSCECKRDVGIAKEYGFKGKVLPVFPNTGGFDLEAVSKLRSDIVVSERKKIMLKGYQGWVGRALVGLRALERCADILAGYEVVIYSASKAVLIAAELFSQSTGVQTTIIPKETPHHEILKLHGEARISIGLSISDAISTSLLEAVVMGSFPIQSWTSCGNEWIEDGKTGILVPPDDPDVVENAIRKALTNDNLVNNAAEINWLISVERLNANSLKRKTIEFYKQTIDQ